MDNTRYHSATVDKALALNIREADAVAWLLGKNTCMAKIKLKLKDWLGATGKAQECAA
jgi:hypothetical protein